MTTYQADAGFTGETFPVGAVGQTTTWVYDGDPGDPDGVDNGTGLLVAKLDAAGKGASYTYGTGGRLASRTWARGGTTTYSHDPNTGELLSVDYSDSTPDIGYTYDSLGRQATVTDAMGVRTFSYDPATLQLVSESIDAADPADDVVLTRKYETGAENNGVRGRAAGLYLDDASKYNLTYGYSGVGRFDRVHFDVGDGQSNTVDQATYSYVSNSNLLAGMTTSSGQATTYQYEPTRDVRTQVKNVFDANTVSQYDYRYDELGRRTDVVTGGQAFGGSGNEELSLWGYNDRNELVASNRHAGADPQSPGAEVLDEKRSYLYDPIGNRKTALGQDGTTPITYTANQLNQYDLIDAAAPTYDDDGNMTADGEGKTLAYNGENRLVAFDDGAGTTASYEYDYIGRRVKKTVGSATTSYVWDGWNLIRETTDDGAGGVTTRHNVWGLDLSQSMQGAGGIGGLIAVVQDGGDAKLFAYDGNGNVGQVVAAGVVDAAYEYDAFGNVVAMAGASAEDNAWRFSTKAVDAESGFVMFQLRPYIPETGRWLNHDPVGERGGLNLYGFVGNEPTDYLDRLGLFSIAFYTTGDSELSSVYAKVATKLAGGRKYVWGATTVGKARQHLVGLSDGSVDRAFFVGHGIRDAHSERGGAFMFHGHRLPRGGGFEAKNENELLDVTAVGSQWFLEELGRVMKQQEVEIYFLACYAGTQGKKGTLQQGVAEKLEVAGVKLVKVTAYTGYIDFRHNSRQTRLERVDPNTGARTGQTGSWIDLPDIPRPDAPVEERPVADPSAGGLDDIIE